MNLFQEAAQLNNAGIDALINGDSSSAIQSMTKAIKTMKAQLAQSSTPNQKYDSSTAKASMDTHMVEVPMASSDHIVVNQVVQIPIESTQEISDFDMHVYSGAIIFNLALAHHFRSSSGNTSCMNKAEKLYSMVLKLLDNASLNVHTALMVKLACINNLSQIRYFKGDYDNAREGLSEVSHFMRHSPNKAIFEEQEIQGLLMNILLLKAPQVAPAA